jgi:hypothetical protein
MTRLEWFNEQSEEIKDKFKHNCNTFNSFNDFFDWWISKKDEELFVRSGISGAFTFNLTPEGHDFWANINAKTAK